MKPGETLKRLYQSARFGVPLRFNPEKRRIIDSVFGGAEGARSFADLGGVWAVDGAYTFYALRRYPIRKAFLVDTRMNDAVLRSAGRHPELTLLRRNFGEADTPDLLGKVDAVFLFDVLLHQVKPDWDEVLTMYSKVTDCFVVYNQQWSGAGSRVRLLDLGRDEYFANVPHDPEEETYRLLFEKMDELNEEHGRPWRDIHAVWQWGITDDDLRAHMDSLGYEEHYYADCGPFGSLRNFRDRAFVFRKR